VQLARIEKNKMENYTQLDSVLKENNAAAKPQPYCRKAAIF